MPRVIWNTVGERVFEAGVDRGVLFIDDEVGVPWNGLISITESPDGADITPYYYDGIKYLDRIGSDEFNATIVAYTYPDEFAQCEGQSLISNGLFATYQSRKSFGLIYRTQIGNDVSGIDYGYKIHIVYNATATVSDRDNNTLGDSIDPFNFSWEIVTKPPTFTGYIPTSHFVIDSRDVPSELLTIIENVLYGSDILTSRLPTITELRHIFENYLTTIFDSGYLIEEQFVTYDAGIIPEEQTTTLDAGGPGSPTDSLLTSDGFNITTESDEHILL